MPNLSDKSGSLLTRSSDVLIRAATANSAMPWIIKEVRSDRTRPIRSITSEAAAVPGTPRVFTSPASQRDLYGSNPARLKSVPDQDTMAKIPVHC